MHNFTPKRCDVSGKIMYRTKPQAQEAARDGYWERGTQLWVYQCPYCGCWHLTHHAPIPDEPGGSRGGTRGFWNNKPRSRHRGYKPRRR